jgi:hypothetical protein
VFWTFNKGCLARFFAFQGYFIDIGSEDESYAKRAVDQRVHIVNERVSNTKVENFEEKDDHERERLVN